MLASTFVTDGYSALRHPSSVPPEGRPVVLPFAERVKALQKDPEQLVRINGAVQVGAGALLALGRFPRLSAFTLAATLIPATLAAHPYWTVEDPDERGRQRDHFYKNLSMLGGLLVVAADTHGKPSLAYRSRRGTVHVTADAKRRAGAAVSGVRDHLPDHLPHP